MTAIKRLPYMGIIVPIEEMVIKIPKTEGDELKWKMKSRKKFAIKSLWSESSIINTSSGQWQCNGGDKQV